MSIRLGLGFLIGSLLATAWFPASAGTAGASSQVASDQEFDRWVSALTDQISKDKNYKRVPADSDQQVADLTAALYRLYRDQMNDAQFMDWVNQNYPGHDYEIAVILHSKHVYRRSPRR